MLAPGFDLWKKGQRPAHAACRLNREATATLPHIATSDRGAGSMLITLGAVGEVVAEPDALLGFECRTIPQVAGCC